MICAQEDRDMDKFLKGYIAAALWSSTDANKDDEPLDRRHDEDDLAPETLSKMNTDCFDFKCQNEALLNEAYQHMSGDEEFDPEFRAGFCFWLNRNGHGSGFWDERGIDKNGIGEKLSEACKYFGQYDLYV